MNVVAVFGVIGAQLLVLVFEDIDLLVMAPDEERLEVLSDKVLSTLEVREEQVLRRIELNLDLTHRSDMSEGKSFKIK